MANNEFGSLLRLARQSSNRTLQDVGSHIGISAAYLSKVERGQCPPLREHLIVTVAEFLGIRPDNLLRASVKQRAEFDVVRPRTVESYAFLLRRLNSLTDDELGQIDLILRHSAKTFTDTNSDESAVANNTITMPQGAQRRDRYGQ